MKAVPFFEHGPADVLHYAEFPEPAGRRNVIVDVEYCGVNHLDIWTRTGIPGKKIGLPHICGCDIVGTVRGQRVMVYPGVSCGKCAYCTVGRENLCTEFVIIGGMSDWNGGYAEKVAVPARNVIRIPKELKSEAAAALSVSYLVAWNMLKANGASRGKKVLVYGATSGVGMATIQLGGALGAKVITTASGEEKYRFAEKLGADHIIDRSASNISEMVKKVAPDGVDIVVDHVGAATWPTSISAVRQGGRVAVCGMTSGNEAIVPVRMFYSKQIVMTGALLGSRAELLELVRFVVRKRIRPIIDTVMPLKAAPEAHRRMEAGRHMGKILLRCKT